MYQTVTQGIMNINTIIKTFLSAAILLIAVSCFKETIYVNGISLDKQTLTLKVGESVVLNAEVTPSNASNKALVWTSSDTGVAAVSQGKVTAKKAGKSTIIVSTECGGYTSTCDLEVKDNVSGIRIDESLELYEFQQAVLKADILTVEGGYSNESIIWECSEDSLLTVFAGTVLAKKAPEDGHIVIVSATTKDSKYKAVCGVTVKCHVSGLQLNKTIFDLEPEQQARLQATILPSRATDKRIQFLSSRPDIATVSPDGQIKAIKASQDTVNISVASLDEYPNHAATCFVVVKKAVKNLCIIHEGKRVDTLSIKEGGNTDLVAALEPEDATTGGIVWKSSDETVVKIGQDGHLTAIGKGSANITATFGGFSAACRVTVFVPISEVTLSSQSIELFESQYEDLSYVVSPDGAAVKKVEWKSDNDDIAIVKSGRVTAMHSNDRPAAITLTVCDAAGNVFERTCSVKVKCCPSSIKVSPRTIVLTLGNGGKSTADLTAEVLPARVSNPSVTWSSSDNSLVEVDQNGHIEAKGITPDLKPVILKAETVEKSAAGEPLSDECEVIVLRVVEGISIMRKGGQTPLNEVSLKKNENLELTACLSPGNVPFDDVIWTSCNKNVASITPEGELKGTGGGETNIIASSTDGGKTAVCLVKVHVPITDIELEGVEPDATVTMNEGESKEFAVVFSPEDATGSVSWTSGNDAAVPIVGSRTEGNRTYCKVLAVKSSDSAIRIAVKVDSDESKQLQFYVSVKCPVEKVQVENKNVTLEKGKKMSLAANVYPLRASQTVSWESEAPERVAVDPSTGEITAELDGEDVTVWAISTVDKSKKDFCLVKVVGSSVPVSSVEVIPSVQQLQVGESFLFSANVLPSTATNKSLVWTSSNSNVARVANRYYGSVEAVSAGTAIITATAQDGSGEFASATLTVSGTEPQPDIRVTGVSISTSGSANMNVGDRKKFTAIISPSNASNKTVSWSVANNAVASVSQDGTVTAGGEGTTTLTVRTNDGGFTSSITISVAKKSALQSISLSENNLELYKRQKYTLGTIYTPAGITPASKTWISTNPSIVSVGTNSGELEALNTGEANIYLVADGVTSNYCHVTVKLEPTIEIDRSDGRVTSKGLVLDVGESYQVKLKFTPPEASDMKILWSFSSPGTQTIAVQDGKVTGIHEGDAVLYYEIEGFSKSKMGCHIKINAVKPVSMSIDKSAVTLKVGDSVTLSPVFQPYNTTNKAISEWTSSDKSIVEVSDGVIKAKSVGKAMVQATSKALDASGKQVKAICYITVTDAAIGDNTGENVGFDDLN